MTFNSIEFLVFLPVVFVLYWFVFGRRLRLQNLFVVAASYVFYGWWDWRFLVLIAFTSLCSWCSGILIGKYGIGGGKSKIINVLNIVVNLAVLGLFKYYDFFAQSFADIFLGGKADGLLLDIILPVGISFYTFQALSYSIDVYRGKIAPTRDIVEFFAYVSFFPQLVAGPIERATNLLPQFQRKREFDFGQAVAACHQILWGLFKKMVVADNCAFYVDKVFGVYQAHSASTLLLAAVLFSFQIYGDFSGYSDIAVGTARLFGIKLMRNFNIPYFSRDIAEFWRRWHISLTTWFRDYVYIPLGGSRCSKLKVVRNTFVIFLLSGLWHGANWTFVVWGVYNAVLFLPLILSNRNRKNIDIVAGHSFLPSLSEALRMLLTFAIVTLGWVIFRSDSIGDAFEYVVGMIDGNIISIPFLYVGTKKAIFFVFLMIVVEWFSRRDDYAFQFLERIPGWMSIIATYAMMVVLLEFASHSQSFIYFQF